MRQKTSFNLRNKTHEKLRDLSETRGTSMGVTIEYLVELGWLVHEATPPTEKVIEQIVRKEIRHTEMAELRDALSEGAVVASPEVLQSLREDVERWSNEQEEA